jgi:hypothetical protein
VALRWKLLFCTALNCDPIGLYNHDQVRDTKYELQGHKEHAIVGLKPTQAFFNNPGLKARVIHFDLFMGALAHY